MHILSIFMFFMFLYWLSNRLSRPAPKPFMEPWHRGVSTEELVRLYDSCDILVFGRIENLENMDVERYVMGARHRFVEVHLEVRVALPQDLKDSDAVINSCYFTRQGDLSGGSKGVGVYPGLNDKICLGLFMNSVKNGVHYLGSNNPFYLISDDKWMPYARRQWIDLIPADRPLTCDFTDSGSSIN